MSNNEIIKSKGLLKNISPHSIDKNPENPRLFFRSEELDNLLASIARIGIQVPVTVYQEKNRYILIDGERRWRCAIKLNLPTIPALIQNKPTALDNLLLMFNIHSLREQWDLFTIAMKLPKVIELIKEQKNKDPTVSELSIYTGLSSSTIRRCKLLINLPEKYKKMASDELKLSKSKQKLTEDFFVELEKSISVVKRKIPSIIDDTDRIRDVLILKYRTEIIPNVLHFRKISKIARSEKLGVSKEKTINVLSKLFQDNDYSIEAAFNESAEELYAERELETRIQWLLETIKDEKKKYLESDEIMHLLQELKNKLDRILGVG